MNLKGKTKDELNSLMGDIHEELEDRGKETLKRIYVVTLSDSTASFSTYFKNINDAIKELQDEATIDVIVDLSTTISIGPLNIPKSEYINRPDRWYD